ncbi:DDE-type integrase/transposase/recombinase [Rhodococcus erythropolis]|nr:DDE-type integrase/transposase/recombinase [Rhodococcus erythropolis]MDV6277954.1 DDE-type integrase/transposase/recombinase [Rhodococcus erythropolis]
MFVNIDGLRKYLWRAVDQHGNVLDISDPIEAGR